MKARMRQLAAAAKKVRVLGKVSEYVGGWYKGCLLGQGGMLIELGAVLGN